VADEWNRWWRAGGEGRLSLLLWAVWNPIGPVPLDEYANYTGRVVAVLRRAREADSEIVPPEAQSRVGARLRMTLSEDEGDYAVQGQRNLIYAAAVDELSALLGTLRTHQIGARPNPDRDRQAAETLLDWYEWEMYETDSVR
jgi:hypothetical protein